MSIRKLAVSAALTIALAVAPSGATADWLFTPFIGANVGGTANFGDFNDSDDEFERRVDFGASLGWMGAGIAGFEVDFGFSPNFFQDTVGDANFEFGDNYLTTLMGNVLVGVPIGGQAGSGIRPYAAGGVGLVRAKNEGDFFSDLDTTDFGFNLGGGVHGFFNDTIGVRGDVRYFRSLVDSQPDDFDFWRVTAGVTFRFGNN